MIARIELAKQARRARTRATLGLMVALPLVLTLVIGTTRRSLAERIGNFSSVVTGTTGLTVPLIALSTMLLFVFPLAVAIFAGECVAGDSSWGSLRYILARPVARWRVLGAKAAVAAGYSVAAVLVAVVVGLVAGTLAFGWHPLTVLDLEHTTPFIVTSAKFAPLTALGRVALSSAYVIAMLTSTFAASLFFSTLTDRAFSAVAGGVGLSLVSRALDNIPGLHALSPWLPVTDSASTRWTGFFDQPLQTAGIGRALAVQAAYTAVFLGAALVRFTRADVLR